MVINSTSARLIAAAIALLGWAGLAIQFGATYELTGSVPQSLWVLLRYFTVITNLLSAVVMTGLAFGLSQFRSPALLGGTTLSIAIVGILYSLLLRGMIELSGGALLADAILHDAVPVAVVLYWLVVAPKGQLKARHAGLWAIYPLLYSIYALVRGAIENKYAYPFIDVTQIGWQHAAVNSVMILVAFLAAAFGLVQLDRWLGRSSKRT